MIDSYIGLGSNLGDRQGKIRGALECLAATPGVERVIASSLYASAPWGVADQPVFINAVARVATVLGPIQLFLRLREIEKHLGRTPTFRWGPREIDLDILLYGDCQIQRRGLIIPHPSMHERAFVLAPLREIWPDYRLPSGVTIDAALEALLTEQDVSRLDESEP